MNEIKKQWAKWLYWFLFAVAVITVYKTLDSFGEILDFIKHFIEIITPFLAGLLIAYLFYIPARNIENWIKKCKIGLIANKARGLSLLVVYAVALLLIILSINVIFPVILNSVVDLASNLQGYYARAVETINNLPEDSFIKGDLLTNTIEGLKNIDLKQYINANDITQYAKGVINVASSVFNIFVALAVSIYILSGRREILIFIKKAASATFEEKTLKNLGKYFNSTNQIFFRFIASQLLDAIVVGVLITIAFSVIGIKYAPLLGFIIGLFNMIPYFGSIIAVAIGVLITLISGGLTQTIWMLLVAVVIQQIDANVINPKLLGNSLKVSPIIIIVAVTIGGAYFGILGMFLAVPLAAALKIVIMDSIEFRLKQKQEEKGILKNQIKIEE